MTDKKEPKILNSSYLPLSKIGDFSNTSGTTQENQINYDTNEVRSSPRNPTAQSATSDIMNINIDVSDMPLLIGENTPKPSSKHSFEKEKDDLNKVLENLEVVIFDCNSKIEEINKIRGYEEIKAKLLLEFTQKIESTQNHILLINSHFDKITEIENISEVDQDIIFNVLNIAGVVGNEKEKAWLLTRNWQGLLNDSHIKELIEDQVNDRDQKERVGSVIISKY